jgi:hypothetical protein
LPPGLHVHHERLGGHWDGRHPGIGSFGVVHHGCRVIVAAGDLGTRSPAVASRAILPMLIKPGWLPVVRKAG